jgi:hypothetical protein
LFPSAEEATELQSVTGALVRTQVLADVEPATAKQQQSIIDSNPARCILCHCIFMRVKPARVACDLLDGRFVILLKKHGYLLPRTLAF